MSDDLRIIFCNTPVQAARLQTAITLLVDCIRLNSAGETRRAAGFQTENEEWASSGDASIRMAQSMLNEAIEHLKRA